MQQIAGLNVEHRRVVPWEIPRAIFHIPLPNRSPVFMSLPPCDVEDSSRSVVVVRARTFLTAWQANPNNIHAGIANGNPTMWIKDRKFQEAAKGFEPGIENPVPLAEVECSMHENLRGPSWFRFLSYARDKQASVSFTNGVTRTIWLLVNGAESFPVECRSHSASLLAQHCGTDGARAESAYLLTHKASAATV